MSFTETLLMLLIGFKLTGCITWSWWWVLCPLCFSCPVRKYTYVNMGFISGKDEKGKRIHPTQKPLQLFQTILRDFSKPDDIILDPFSGSGTTAVACHKLGRHFICVEKDLDYWAASVKRLDEERRQMTIFDVLGRN